MLDERMYELRKTVLLYLHVVRIVFGTKLAFGEATMCEIFEAIESILRVNQTLPLFILMSNEVMKH
jgi:hypothetical protein